jgi:hypothetical protein
MGEIKHVSSIHNLISKHRAGQFPIIFCALNEAEERVILDAGYQRIYLNLQLAEALTAFEGPSRTALAPETALSLIPRGASLYILDYEMLFDARYGIDALKFFIDISRRQRLIVKWCGRLADKTLVYAQPGHPDYRQYPVADYDVTCII